MKKSNSYLDKILLGIFVFLILFPILTMIVWVFTERWAWPNLLPQIFSTRALDEVFGRKEELIQLFASSIFISAVVGCVVSNDRHNDSKSSLCCMILQEKASFISFRCCRF